MAWKKKIHFELLGFVDLKKNLETRIVKRCEPLSEIGDALMTQNPNEVTCQTCLKEMQADLKFLNSEK